MTVCSIPDCAAPVDGRGWCKKHYTRWYRHGDPLAIPDRPVRAIDPGCCEVDGCDRPFYARGVCRKHYRRLIRLGTPLLPPAPTTSQRFWAKVDCSAGPTGCWLWTASTRYGYGQFRESDGVNRLTHRFAYEELIGPIPGGLELDHLCRVRNCVNPAHLEPVTGAENHRRMRAAQAEKSAA